MRRLLLLLLAAFVAAGCAGVDPLPKGSVIIYGRNEAPGIAWFGLLPSDPRENVGFGPDIGVACLRGLPGTEIVSFAGDPKKAGQPTRSLGRVPGGQEPAVIWVDVAPDGTLSSGIGVPPWWPDAAHPC
jgi:hypothetical protein